MILVAPTEPPALKTLGTSSSLPESYGADFLWSTKRGQLCGIQRKELSDFIASLNDGRLSKELAQMQSLPVRALVLEGRGKWTNDGWLVSKYVKFNKKALVSAIASVQMRGVWAFQSDNLNHTKEVIEWLQEWSDKESHTSTYSRPGPGDSWGRTSSRDYAIHLLTSLPGIGTKTAEAIVDYFGGVPLEWSVDEKELVKVPGIGKVTAKKMMEVMK